ncbi:hypothetical protein GCM10011494_37320 [Novosphingobium endophyticum]|uniref:Core-binding (CB) domain-containing protein n=1 Tax=Novosphingobium endophyticum TaxID=1955250 RepID=A0A916X663_9SPHN|nr:hypothetical protein [Novosphingobium endophyticum]GGC15026.1 hypothetical protein GCM10011494_37320 [Novosphingobium endophyticum]
MHLELKPSKEMTRTFREAALDFLEAKSADAKISDAKRKQNLSQLKAYAFPALGKLQVQSIDADAIAACLRPIWTSKPETARKVRSLIIRTLRFARPDGALFIGTLGPAVADRLPAQAGRVDSGWRSGRAQLLTQTTWRQPCLLLIDPRRQPLSKCCCDYSH